MTMNKTYAVKGDDAEMIRLESEQQPLWQWDTGRRLVLTKDPAGTVVDFVQMGFQTKSVVSQEQNGTVYVRIPNEMLYFNTDLYVYIRYTEDDDTQTVFETSFPVHSRPKPEDYISSDEEVRTWKRLEARIAELETIEPVQYTPQTLLPEQQNQARENIGAQEKGEYLTADMGAELKQQIDAIQIPSKLAQMEEDSRHRTVTDEEKEIWNNKQPAGDYITADALHTVIADAERTMIDLLTPAFCQKASVIRGNLVADYPMSVKSHIEPVQEGTGDPSPENVRPIHASREVKLVKCGKNLIHYPYHDKNGSVSGGITFTINPDGSVHAKGTATTTAYFNLERGLPSGILGNRIVDGSVIEAFANGFYFRDVTYEPSGKCFIAVREIGTPIDKTYYPMIAKSDQAVPFERYHGETYTAQFDEGVYGGVYDWTAGTLTVTEKCVTIDGTSMAFTDAGEIYRLQDHIISNAMGGTGSANNLFRRDAVRIDDENGWILLLKSQVSAQGIASVTELNDLCRHTPLQIIYRLKTPEKMQLTPQPIPAFSGTTTIFSDAGDTEVVGRADPNAVIAKMQEDITVLQSAAIKP